MWEVQRIVKERSRGGRTEYLVHWKAGDSTWEQLEHVKALDKFKEYKASKEPWGAEAPGTCASKQGGAKRKREQEREPQERRPRKRPGFHMAKWW